MPIAFDQYVDITSSVGGVAVASNRELILRLVTTNELVPTGTVLEFTSSDDVGTHFGTTSEEFLQAQFYFGFINKLSTTASRISFTFWAEVDTVPLVFGETDTYVLGTFTDGPITDGAMTVTMGPDVEVITGIDFTGDTSLADVAATIEAAIIATAASVQFTGATVTFNAVDQRFELVGGGPAGAAAMDIAAGGSGTEVAPLIGWQEPGALFSDGEAIQTLTEVLTASSQLSNNYGSFAFIPTLDNTQITEVATWNDGENVKYMYLEKTLSANAQDLFDLIDDISGTGVTLFEVLTPSEYPWLLPAAIFASTPYFRRASVQNYMFQQASLTASVTTTTLAQFFDGIRTNYYGVTQQAGALLAFYQRGFLMGGSTDPIDMGVYANEVFLKDAIGVSIFNLLLAVPVVPANAAGTAQVLAAIQGNIDDALDSGIISVGKILNDTQVAFITVVTGDENAFLQIQNIGYWITAEVTEPTSNEFVVNYTLLYSKNDAVRKVEGTHTLI